MALLACPECSREVSDKAAACPHCGYPLQGRTPPAVPAPDDTDARLTQALLTRGKIAAVKLCRELHPGTDLAQAKARVDRLEASLPAGTGPRVGGAGCLWLLAALLALGVRYGAGAFS